MSQSQAKYFFKVFYLVCNYIGKGGWNNDWAVFGSSERTLWNEPINYANNSSHVSISAVSTAYSWVSQVFVRIDLYLSCITTHLKSCCFGCNVTFLCY